MKSNKKLSMNSPDVVLSYWNCLLIILQFDSDDKYPILLFGGGALVAVYIATAVVGAIDSIPLVCTSVNFLKLI